MNYISLLTGEEIAILCNIISGKGFKVLFKKNSKDFAKIKPGFRTNGISEKDAVSLAVRNIDKSFITSFVNTSIQNWLMEIDEFYADLISKGKNEDEALAETLSNSVFDDNLALYFKLVQKEVDEIYLAKLKEYIAASSKSILDDADESGDADAHTIIMAETESLREQLAQSAQQINAYESQLQALEEEYSAMEKAYADAQKKAQSLLCEKEEMEAELSDFRARVKYDDTEDASAAVEVRDFDYISLCEVAAPDYRGQVWLNRLADIGRNGTIEVFYENEDMPKYFGNRSRLFFNDGPNKTGSIGVWNWKSIPNNNDSSRDYVAAEFNAAVEPIEIIIVQECKTAKDLLEKLQAGIDVEITSRRVILAAYLPKGQYVGILCRYSDLEQNGNQTRLNKRVISLPQYDISGKDITHLPNGKVFYRSIKIGVPSAVVNVKDPMDIVKTVIFARNSWKTLKQQGKTRGEWRNIRDFLDGLDTAPIIDDIAVSANCSHVDAQKMLDEFIEYAGSYIDGTSIEDGVVSAVIVTNPELMERCKALIMDDWIAENQTAVNDANATLAGLHKEIEQARAQRDKEYTEAQECIAKQKAVAEDELAAVKHEHDTLQSTLQTISTTISEKEKLAADVEMAVTDRIRRAQSNAAEFIASMAFATPAAVNTSETVVSPSVFEVKTSVGENQCFVSGTALDADNLEEISTWKTALETISMELIEAGVTAKYSRQLAAYMYAAYVNKSSLLMIGPNASAIADAFSGAVFGKMAGTLECTESYNAQSVEACYSSVDSVVKIINPFSTNWISRIPNIVSNGDKLFIAIYPYSEDIQIEPKSLYNYMLPVFTELFVDKAPSGNILGGKCTEAYKDFKPVKASKSHSKLLVEMHTSMLVRTKIQVLLNNMHTMLNDQDLDYDVMFALLPYAYATMQTSLLLEAVQDGEKKKISISSNLLELLNDLYGENE